MHHLIFIINIRCFLPELVKVSHRKVFQPKRLLPIDFHQQWCLLMLAPPGLLSLFIQSHPTFMSGMSRSNRHVSNIGSTACPLSSLQDKGPCESEGKNRTWGQVCKNAWCRHLAWSFLSILGTSNLALYLSLYLTI